MNLLDLLQVKQGDRYTLDAKEVAEANGVQRSAVYMNRKDKASARHRLDKVALFDKAKAELELQSATNIVRGGKASLVLFMHTRLEKDKQYVVYFTEV